jgi:hypothetical protein
VAQHAEPAGLNRLWKALLALPFILLGLTLLGVGVEFGVAVWAREGNDTLWSLFTCTCNPLSPILVLAGSGCLPWIARWVGRK